MDEQEQRAHEAKRILESSLFSELFETIDERIVKGWRAAADEAERTRLWLKQQCLAEVRRELFSEIEAQALKEQSDGLFRRTLKALRGI